MNTVRTLMVVLAVLVPSLLSVAVMARLPTVLRVTLKV